ncbi:hypothetical protein AB0M10_14355 [Streptomyces sp. NPDC051840]|uniref:hypothetical protein n=1 Tax=unclassified Streptomyces TaxID=2593676 RepID=UPI003421C95D
MSDWKPEPDTEQRDGADDAAGQPPAEPPTPCFDPAPPAPLGITRTPTGHAGVDARLDRLADADHLAADGHTEVYEDVHRGLREELTALDARPAPAPTRTHDNRS